MEVFSDSRLVMGQVKGELEARDVRMQDYLSQARRLQSDFEFFNLTHVSGVETRMRIHWPLLPRSQSRVYLKSSLLRTCTGQI